jgi:hypothetical protein
MVRDRLGKGGHGLIEAAARHRIRTVSMPREVDKVERKL